MKEYQSLLKDIKKQQTLPIYFLHGLEPFFIDALTEAIETHMLDEEQKVFNQHIVYGLETRMDEVIAMAKQFPFGSDHQLVIVKEAQHLNLKKEEEREPLLQYLEQPQLQTTLVFNYKNAKLNGNLKLAKNLKKKGYLFQSDPIYDNQLPQYIQSLAQAQQLELEGNSVPLLENNLGNDLSKVNNELKKLKMIMGSGAKISPDDIEKHIGISKDFNNFELNRAIAQKDYQKAFSIIHYFEQNPKDHPVILTVSTLYMLFTNIIKFHIAPDKSDANLLRLLNLGRSYHRLNEYKMAARNFTLKQSTRALDLLQEVDLKSKGIGSSESNDPTVLREFAYKIFYTQR